MAISGNIALMLPILNDVLAVADEIFNATLAQGAPDCDLDGNVSLADAIGILKAARPFGAVPCSN